MSDVYVVDATAAIELARREHANTSGDYEFFAPTLLRSHVLSRLHTDLATAGGDSGTLLALAESACRLPRRLLGDAVLRSTAWRIATEQGWLGTFDAEYIALTQLHGKALVCADEDLRARAEGIVPTETVASFVARHHREGGNA